MSAAVGVGISPLIAGIRNVPAMTTTIAIALATSASPPPAIVVALEPIEVACRNCVLASVAVTCVVVAAIGRRTKRNRLILLSSSIWLLSQGLIVASDTTCATRRHGSRHVGNYFSCNWSEDLLDRICSSEQNVACSLTMRSVELLASDRSTMLNAIFVNFNDGGYSTTLSIGFPFLSLWLRLLRLEVEVV
jgi:hypothetical protein